MADLYLFNISGAKLSRIRVLCVKLGIFCQVIPREAFGKTFAVISGRETDTPSEAGETFGGEMLVMDGFDSVRFHGLLDGLRRERAAVALKAVITEQNLTWTPIRLYRELAAEHEALNRARCASSQASVHDESTQNTEMPKEKKVNSQSKFHH